ncbi:MAG: hypothetical protein FWD72_06840, partial [Eggerthellaceae bacterium]|nr:hypothetical protein [Eggerthellaceae bacterium]
MKSGKKRSSQKQDNSDTHDGHDIELFLDMMNGCSPGVSLGLARSGGNGEVFLTTTDRFRHMYVLGPSGTGKTTYLVAMALQDLNEGTPFAFFDPGNAVDQIIRLAPRQRLENVVFIDFNDPDCRVRLNLFDIDITDKAAVDRVCEDAVDLLRGDIPYAWAGARFEQKVRAAAMTILDVDFPHPRSLLLVGKLILDDGFRSSVLKHIKSEYVHRAWRAEDDASRSYDHGEVNQWIYSKFDIFDTNAVLQQVFGPGTSTIDVECIMAEGTTLLVKIDESVIGERVAKLFTRFFTKQEKRAVMRRRLQAVETITPYMLYFDEFQRFVSAPFAELLSESRKYSVGLVLANQNLHQLVQFNHQDEVVSSEVLDSVLANAGTLVAFRPSAKDAAVLAPEFDVRPEELRRVPQYAAMVKLLSAGSMDRPLVVSMPMAKGPADSGNAAWLVGRMLEKGIWTSPEEEGGKEAKAAAAAAKKDASARKARRADSPYVISEYSEPTDSFRRLILP